MSSQDERSQDIQRMIREARDVVRARRSSSSQQAVVQAPTPAPTDGSSSHAGNSSPDREQNAKRDTRATITLLDNDNMGTYMWAHTKDHDRTTFINKRSTQLDEEITAGDEMLTQQGISNYDKDEMYLDLVGGHDKKQRVFGWGSLAKNARRRSVSSDGRTPDFSTSDDRMDRMERRMDEFNEPQLSIMDQLKQWNAKFDRRGPDPSDSGAGTGVY